MQKKSLVLLKIILPLVVLGAVFATLGIADAYSLWGPKWSNNNVNYNIANQYTIQGPGWNNMANAAANEWNNIGGTPFMFILNGGAGTNTLTAGALASGCVNFAETSRIAILNDLQKFTTAVNTWCGFSWYDGTQAATIPSNYWSLRDVVLHEFGHGMGLCHTNKNGKIMSTPFIGPGIDKALTKDDKQGNRKIYSPTYGGIGPEGPCVP